MKAVKYLGIALGVWVAIVVIFETAIGIIQPQAGEVLVITTTAEDGSQNDRVLAHLTSQGTDYVAANHWPRAWYNAALANPNVSVAIGDERKDYTAVPISGAEHEQVDGDNPLPLPFRFVTGFPPRYFLRLDPKAPEKS